MGDVRVTINEYDLPGLVDQLNRLVRIRTTSIGMKMFETVEAMEAVPKIRRPKDIHTTDQIVGMASRLNWTVGITATDLVGAQCAVVIGLIRVMTSGCRATGWRACGSRTSRSRACTSTRCVCAVRQV